MHCNFLLKITKRGAEGPAISIFMTVVSCIGEEALCFALLLIYFRKLKATWRHAPAPCKLRSQQPHILYKFAEFSNIYRGFPKTETVTTSALNLQVSILSQVSLWCLKLKFFSHCISIAKTTRLTHIREVLILYSENKAKHMNTLCDISL